MNCRLCQKSNCSLLAMGHGRHYYGCPECRLVFVAEDEFVTLKQERDRYDLHNNTEEQDGYAAYLGSVADELRHIPIEKPTVLDFGCCHEYVLTKILKRRGIDCRAYDPLYDIGIENLKSKYDVVILCEVLEHLRYIQAELELLKSLLRSPGYLLIRTEFYSSSQDIASWWYANDITHVSFFNEISLKVMAQLLDRKLLYSDNKRIAIIGPSD